MFGFIEVFMWCYAYVTTGSGVGYEFVEKRLITSHAIHLHMFQEINVIVSVCPCLLNVYSQN